MSRLMRRRQDRHLPLLTNGDTAQRIVGNTVVRPAAVPVKVSPSDSQGGATDKIDGPSARLPAIQNSAVIDEHTVHKRPPGPYIYMPTHTSIGLPAPILIAWRPPGTRIHTGRPTGVAPLRSTVICSSVVDDDDARDNSASGFSVIGFRGVVGVHVERTRRSG